MHDYADAASDEVAEALDGADAKYKAGVHGDADAEKNEYLPDGSVWLEVCCTASRS